MSTRQSCKRSIFVESLGRNHSSQSIYAAKRLSSLQPTSDVQLCLRNLVALRPDLKHRSWARTYYGTSAGPRMVL